MSDKPILEAFQLHKTFKHPVFLPILRGVSLTLNRGETVAIVGRSGEGKSTLIHVLGTLEAPCQGELHIAGEKVTAGRASMVRNRHLGFIFQSFQLLEDCTALENVLMPARIARRWTTKGSAAYRRGEDLLYRVGLEKRQHFSTKLLSGGEKQRVAIARALCNDPDLILADEPSGNLDRQNAKAIHKLLIDSVKEERKSLLVVTHDPELAGLCDRCYTLQDGVLVP